MERLLQALIESPLFSIALTIGAYQIGVWLSKKTKSPFCNPLLLAMAMVIALLLLTPYTLEEYNIGGNVFTMFLGPATASLALSIYYNLETLKKHFLPIVLGCLAGSVTSMTSVYFLCKAFRLDEALLRSLLPKSVTTPIALELAESAGGLVPIAVVGVLVTGMTGTLLAPLLIRLFRVTEPVAQGVALGTSAHALGTTRAIEMGEIQGAMSGLSIGVAGIWTVVLSLFLH